VLLLLLGEWPTCSPVIGGGLVEVLKSHVRDPLGRFRII
jgi:hypothetical protein